MFFVFVLSDLWLNRGLWASNKATYYLLDRLTIYSKYITQIELNKPGNGKRMCELL